MNNDEFKSKLKSWLKDHDSVRGAEWGLEKDDAPNTMKVVVNYTKTIVGKQTNEIISMFKITGSSLTENTEEAISGAVLALNDGLLNIIGSDSEITDDSGRIY